MFSKKNKKQLRRKPTPQEMLHSCGEIHADDGVDPREYFKPERRLSSEDRKARQLCRQIHQTLDFVLTDFEPDDTTTTFDPPAQSDADLLSSLLVQDVMPTPDSSNLLVIVVSNLISEPDERLRILELLQSQTGRLRSEIARSISRKRVPSLSYTITAASNENPSEGGSL